MDEETIDNLRAIRSGLKSIQIQMQQLRDENFMLSIENERLKRENAELIELAKILASNNKNNDIN